MEKPTTILLSKKMVTLKNVWRKVIITLSFALLILCPLQVVLAQQIFPVDEAVSEMLASDNTDTFLQGMHLQSLLGNIQPALYINNGELTAFGDSEPIILYADANSIQGLYSINPLFSKVELIEIRLKNSSEIPSTIFLDQLGGFPNLQYVFVKFGFDACGYRDTTCLYDIISNLFTDSQTPVVVLYGLSIPE